MYSFTQGRYLENVKAIMEANEQKSNTVGGVIGIANNVT